MSIWNHYFWLLKGDKDGEKGEKCFQKRENLSTVPIPPLKADQTKINFKKEPAPLAQNRLSH